MLAPAPATVEVRPEAALADSEWTQAEAKKLVWASGCTNWAIDVKTGMNNMMYPDWQFWFWFRSVFWKRGDFVYRDEKTGESVRPGEAMRWVGRIILAVLVTGAVVKKESIMEAISRGLGGVRGSQLVHRLRA